MWKIIQAYSSIRGFLWSLSSRNLLALRGKALSISILKKINKQNRKNAANLPACSALQESLSSCVLQEQHSQRFLMPLVLFSCHCLHSTSRVFAPCLPIYDITEYIIPSLPLDVSHCTFLSWFWCI